MAKLHLNHYSKRRQKFLLRVADRLKNMDAVDAYGGGSRDEPFSKLNQFNSISRFRVDERHNRVIKSVSSS